MLEVQKSCLRLCSSGVSLENIYNLMLTLIGQKLKELGILKDSTSEGQVFKVLGFFVYLFSLLFFLAKKNTEQFKKKVNNPLV